MPEKDGVTRYLCAAAHLDRKFADDAIREFLTEPTRAFAPSPGVDGGAVLREAVAARTRRRTRDAVLCALVLLFAFAAPLTTLWWAVIAVIAALPRWGARLAKPSDPRNPQAKSAPPALFVGLVVAALYLLVQIVMYTTGESLFDSGSRYDSRYEEDPEPVPVVPFLIAPLIVLVVLLDRLAVWSMLTTSFRRDRFRAPTTTDRWLGERRVRSLGHRAHEAELAAWDGGDASAGAGPVTTVYRGYDPFVGAGLSYQPWSLAFPLDPKDPERAVTPFTLAELYDAVQHDLLSLGRSAALSPSNRLSGLTAVERVVVPADDLVARVGEPEAAAVLPDPRGRPNRTLPREVADRVLAGPLEWMRYFRCFQVQTWDLDLVVSSYLHLGSDERMLYVEWTPCVLLPVKDGYRAIDRMSRTPWWPVVRTLGVLARLPVTFFGRLWHATMPILPIREQRGQVRAERYGALRSLREMGAADDVQDYFQRTDLERYIKLMEARLLRSIGRFLEERGIAVTEFMAQANQVFSKNVHIEGSVTGNVFVGDHNRSGNVSATARPNG
ncbi:hypothetical protein JOF41_004956 [Saccharothrix coeruleofusca]|uniref:hypothetical protein n=1 Tax=Saccharothrix coeruleofusca TaxID=33919 RepID=UPI001AE5C692|nr:hypothetical protein [Saccharothrix coeruleofusca]MBP2338778.1 hypothetical protein [Saccharothrix coeruleofusca]